MFSKLRFNIKPDKPSLILLVSSIAIFCVMLPLVLQINFPQNDDWVYYENVELIRHEGLELDPYMGPTFFVQGVISALYSFVFSLTGLPVLTLLLSVVSFFIFIKILNHHLGLSTFQSILLGLMFYFTPMNVYTSLGFMTEQYFLPLFLLSIYLFLEYEKSNKKQALCLLLVVSFLALNQRQVALILPISFAVHFLLKRQFSKFWVFFADFILMLSYYLFIFPRTEAMLTKSFAFNHLVEPDYIFALFYGSTVIVVALVLPLFVSYIVQTTESVGLLKTLLFIAGAMILYFVLNANFKPTEISWGEFPYFENTWERQGFYPRGVLGTKYQFKGNFDLYLYWDLVAKVVLSAFFVSLLFRFKKFINIFTILYVFYLGILVVTDTFYDRYTLLFIPLTVLALSTFVEFKKYTYALLLGFVVFLVFYTYQFSMDFVLVNRYIWSKSEALVESNIAPEMIQGTNAWKLKYRNLSKDYLYNFSYDSPDVNEVYKNDYTLVEEKIIDHPLNFFIEPKVFLYKRK